MLLASCSHVGGIVTLQTLFTVESSDVSLLFSALCHFFIFQILVTPFSLCSVYSTLVSNSPQHVSISLKCLTIISTWENLSDNPSKFLIVSLFICSLFTFFGCVFSWRFSLLDSISAPI